MSKNPESAKYRLTRLEIDKNSKLKSIDEANEKLLLTAKEFKDFKVEYIDGQDALTADLDAVTAQMDTKSESLLESYKEHDYLIKKIGVDKIALGTDYPFPLGESEPGNLIESMDYNNEQKDKLLFQNSLDWLGLPANHFS